MVIAARTNDALWQLVGDRGKTLATEIEGQLVSAQQQLDKALQDGVLKEVEKLLGAADARADLRAAFAPAGENVMQADIMRQTVESAVADREVPQMHVDMCDNKKDRDNLIATLKECLSFASEAQRLGLRNQAALQTGEDRVKQFVKEVDTAAKAARQSITVWCTEQVVPYGQFLEMLRACMGVPCVRDEAHDYFEAERQNLSQKVQALSWCRVTGYSGDKMDELVVSSLVELQLLTDIPVCQKEAQWQRDDILMRYRKARSDMDSPLAHLYDRLKSEDTGYGGKAIASRKDLFVAEEIIAFNKKVGAHGIEYVLDNLGLTQRRYEQLLMMYDEYQAKYKTMACRLLQSRSKDPGSFQRHVSECAKAVRDFENPSIGSVRCRLSPQRRPAASKHWRVCSQCGQCTAAQVLPQKLCRRCLTRHRCWRCSRR